MQRYLTRFLFSAVVFTVYTPSMKHPFDRFMLKTDNLCIGEL
jgi:hypothetical protein